MKKLFRALCAASLLICAGCDTEDDDLYETPKYIYELHNDSGQTITINITDKCANLPKQFTIDNQDSYQWVNNIPKYYYQWFPFDNGDNPVIICYGDNVAIDASTLPASRQLMNEHNWMRQKSDHGQNTYISIYTFTEDDYKWACDNAISE